MPKLDSKKAERVDQTDVGGFPPLEEGIYVATLVEVTEAQGPSGPYWKWKYGDVFPEDEADWENPVAVAPGHQFNNISLGESSEFKMAESFQAFGVPADTDTDELVGERVRLVISQREIEKGPRKGQIGNNIDAVLPLEDEPEEGGSEEGDDAAGAEPVAGDDEVDLPAIGKEADKGDEEAIEFLDALAQQKGVDPDEYDTWVKLAKALV